jgi:nucleoside-diphosphate-sugar epimerase
LARLADTQWGFGLRGSVQSRTSAGQVCEFGCAGTASPRSHQWYAVAKIDAAVRDGRDTVEIWGSGRPRREFLHVDDLAGAVVFLMKTWSEEEPINIEAGTDITIAERQTHR